VDFVDKSEDKLVFGIEAESGGGKEDVPNIGSPLTRISVEGENCVELSNVISAEDGVLGSDVLGKDGLQILLLEFSFGHDIS
jgi:hypothetical protein